MLPAWIESSSVVRNASEPVSVESSCLEPQPHVAEWMWEGRDEVCMFGMAEAALTAALLAPTPAFIGLRMSGLLERELECFATKGEGSRVEWRPRIWGEVE